MKMRVGELWQFPVKSLAGEPLQSVEFSLAGIPGDRVVQVYDDQSRVITARTHPRLLGLRATLGPDGEPLVSGQRSRSWYVHESAASDPRPHSPETLNAH